MPAMLLRILSLRNGGNGGSRRAKINYGTKICQTVLILVASLPLSPAVRFVKLLTNQPHLDNRVVSALGSILHCVRQCTDPSVIRVETSFEYKVATSTNVLARTSFEKKQSKTKQNKTRRKNASAVMRSRNSSKSYLRASL